MQVATRSKNQVSKPRAALTAEPNKRLKQHQAHKPRKLVVIDMPMPVVQLAEQVKTVPDAPVPVVEESWVERILREHMARV